MEVAGYIGHANAGIVLYKHVWAKDANFVERLESILSDSQHPRYKWSPAMVGDQVIMKDYRDCFDFKMRQSEMPITESGFEELSNIYSEVMSGVRDCMKHYSEIYNLQLGYEEATNFVKYGVGQHFSVHPDSGFSYSCAVSSIGYIADGYEGGEYFMPYQQLKFFPEKGDLIMHPSDFIYAHSSMPVTKGTKYSVVTMYDYNDRNHQTGSYGSNVSSPSSGLPSASGQVATA
jgi:hypothetical protein